MHRKGMSDRALAHRHEGRGVPVAAHLHSFNRDRHEA